jgi:hypothetical protein
MVWPGTVPGEKSTEEVVGLDVIGHEHLDPCPVGELDLTRGEAHPRPSRTPRCPQVDRIPVPGVLPPGHGMGHVIEGNSFDGRSDHGHRLVGESGCCRNGRWRVHRRGSVVITIAHRYGRGNGLSQ